MALSMLCSMASAALLPTSAAAQDGHLGDLRFGAAYARARGLSPDINAANATVDMAKRTLDTARAAQFPQIGFKADYDYTHQAVEGDYFGVADLDRSDSFNRYGYGVGLSQGVFRPDLLGAVDVAKVGVTGAQLALTETESAVAVQVASEYLAVVDALETLRAQYAELSSTDEQLRQTEIRQRSGLVKDSDVALVRAARESAEANKIDGENAVEAARLKLMLTVGGEFDRVGILQPQTPLPLLNPADLGTWVATALDKRAAIGAAKQAVEAARLGVDMAKNARLPKVDIVGSRVWFDADGGVSGARTDLDERIGLELKLPIFTSGALSANIAKSEAQLEQVQAKGRSTELQIKAGVQRAYMAAISAYRQIDARKRAVDAALDAERTTRVGFEVGTVTTADWLQSVRKRFEAERDFARERLGYLLALVQLKAAAGVLGREDMSRVELLLKFPEPGWPQPPPLSSATADSQPDATP